MSTEHRHCALGDERSWTDLITNLTQLSAARVDEDFDALMGWGSLPPELLPGFLHELTHHWCFLSPVGFTLAMLQLRARRSGVLLFNGKGDTEELSQRLWADLSRYETVATMLRPLAEGLALFAEFDAMSGPESEILSLPSQLTGVFYGLGNFDATKPDASTFRSDRATLMAMRGGYQCFRRKRALLQQPLDLATGGYLAGYLTVRVLWRHLAQADKRLYQETDLLLMYLRSFFYDDPGLVHLMLRPWNGWADHLDIVQYIADRFDTLARVQAHHVRAYEVAIQARGDEAGPPIGMANAILVDATVAATGERLSEAMLAEFETPDYGSIEGLMRAWDGELLHRRDIMYLGSVEDVDVQVDSDGYCLVTTNSGTSRRLQADVNAKPGRASGRIDIFFSTLTDHKARAAVVYRGDARVATSFGGPEALTHAARDRFARLTTSQATIQAATAEMADTMERAIAGGALDKELIADMRTVAAEAAAQIYHNMSTFEVSADNREHAIARMASDGFLDFLGWDDALVDGLAQISLAWPRRLSRDDVAGALAAQGIDLTDLLERLDECSRDYGSALVVATPDVLFAAM
jgi:hypothetical protein